MNTASLTTGRLLRIVAAIAILISGIVHLDLYYNLDYRLASSDVNFGRSILLNAIGAGVIAIALVARKDWFVRAVGILYAVSTIGIFWYTHAGNTFMGFSHGGPAFEPSPQAQLTVAMGIIAILTLAATFVPSVDAADRSMGVPAIGVAFAITAIALIGLTLKWKPDDSSNNAAPSTTAASTASTTAGTGATTGDTTGGSSPAAGGTAIEIKNFAFVAPSITIAKGTTVTWTNEDGTAHTVVAADADVSFISDNISKGRTFQHTFDAAGTFPYICGIHPKMMGTITVTG